MCAYVLRKYQLFDFLIQFAEIISLSYFRLPIRLLKFMLIYILSFLSPILIQCHRKGLISFPHHQSDRHDTSSILSSLYNTHLHPASWVGYPQVSLSLHVSFLPPRKEWSISMPSTNKLIDTQKVILFGNKCKGFKAYPISVMSY